MPNIHRLDSNWSEDLDQSQDIYHGEDFDVIFDDEEAEAWSVTVDKKTLKRMSAKNIKKQDHVWGGWEGIAEGEVWAVSGWVGGVQGCVG